MFVPLSHCQGIANTHINISAANCIVGVYLTCSRAMCSRSIKRALEIHFCKYCGMHELSLLKKSVQSTEQCSSKQAAVYEYMFPVSLCKLSL